MSENINELVKSIAIDIIGLTTIWAVLNNLNTIYVRNEFDNSNVYLYTTIIGGTMSTFIILKYMR